ncbi:LytTR family two component transcriptional regulator [Balneicella halophila]|uniref:LytTR family two component transcriptional regulator n=1 Tax=Balneicella halophila TaxID=1537566 RepID=A0A7L4URE3_BALHA|nr:LytTR family DNA-binding domain-containing protein [Balneicella halophila]PVX52082.1 LytTR family two component transcriptional regulator [Balneicella halophila]
MKCVIVDDEPLALEIIESYLDKVDALELVAKFYNPVEAIEFLSTNEVDLVFLDIQMPNLTGIELIKTIAVKPKFIFTTAYPQYALEGFDLDAVDYLVKPIPFSRFLKAVQKARKLYDLERNGSLEEEAFVFVRSDYEDIKITVKDILYIEGLKDYLKIYMKDIKTPILTLMSFSQMMTKLDNPNFLRVHRSFMVNKQHIEGVKRNKLVIADRYIPVGNTYKAEVLDELGLK